MWCCIQYYACNTTIHYWNYLVNKLPQTPFTFFTPSPYYHMLWSLATCRFNLASIFAASYFGFLHNQIWVQQLVVKSTTSCCHRITSLVGKFGYVWNQKGVLQRCTPDRFRHVTKLCNRVCFYSWKHQAKHHSNLGVIYITVRIFALETQ